MLQKFFQLMCIFMVALLFQQKILNANTIVSSICWHSEYGMQLPVTLHTALLMFFICMKLVTRIQFHEKLTLLTIHPADEYTLQKSYQDY